MRELRIRIRKMTGTEKLSLKKSQLERVYVVTDEDSGREMTCYSMTSLSIIIEGLGGIEDDE